MTLQATKLILKLGRGVKLSREQAAELTAHIDKLQAAAVAARECADMLVFGRDERTFGHIAERAVQVRERLREVLRALDGEG